MRTVMFYKNPKGMFKYRVNRSGGHLHRTWYQIICDFDRHIWKNMSISFTRITPFANVVIGLFFIIVPLKVHMMVQYFCLDNVPFNKRLVEN